MQNYLKFLGKLEKKMRIKLIESVEMIESGEINGLDIKPLKGYKNVFRCRVGKIRIIFEKTEGESVIHDIGYRGDLY